MAKTRPCVMCKADIPPERIECLPETRLCVQCAGKVGNEFHRHRGTVKVSKEGSLKKNYADVTVRQGKRKRLPHPDE